jgi:hypothetical protein
VTCANCGATLTGPFCANCGQAARDFHRPLWTLLSEAVGELLSLDARFVRTLRPLLVAPGQVAKEYLAGRRVSYVPPLRAYLIAALIFFGLFTVFPTTSPPVYVFTAGSAEEAAVRATSARGSRVTIELPEHVWFGDDRFQEVSARARANPDAFALVSYRNIPRAFFLFVPISARLLMLFYWKRGYFVDHLVFALYYHAFVFLGFSMLFVLGRATWLPGLLSGPLWWAIVLWLLAYLPMALRRVYGGSWLKTVLKSIGFGVLYLIGFVMIGLTFVGFMAVVTF